MARKVTGLYEVTFSSAPLTSIEGLEKWRAMENEKLARGTQYAFKNVWREQPEWLSLLSDAEEWGDKWIKSQGRPLRYIGEDDAQ